MKAEVIEAKYEELYAEAKKIFDDNDICGFKKNNGLCNRQIVKEAICYSNEQEGDPYCCCGLGGECPKNSDHCQHYIISKGCSVHSLMCKLWNCSNVTISQEIRNKIAGIKDKAYKYGFIYPRGTLKDAIKCNEGIYNRLLKAASFEEFNKS